MRKVLITILAVTVFGVGAAFAQDMMAEHYWAGLSVGYPGAQVHFGVSDVAPNLSVRGDFGTVYSFGVFTAGLDAMYNLPVDTGDLPLTVYAGLGPTAAFGYGAFLLGANIFGGVEYRLGDVGFEPGGVFFEAGPTLYFMPIFAGGFFGRLGFNYHF